MGRGETIIIRSLQVHVTQNPVRSYANFKTYIKNKILNKKCDKQKHAHTCNSLVLLARHAHAYLFNILLLQRIKHEMLESNNWTVHMHATNCIFNLRHSNGNDKNVVCLILKRYTMGNFKTWSYAVHRPKIKKYAKGKGVTFFHYH